MKIKIEQKDIIPYIYFVSSMAQQSKNGMFGSLSSKSDLVGGIFDRWINIIPESVSFNQYFLPEAVKQAGVAKDVRVFSDFYMYDPKLVGIAPDVIGLKINDKIIPFIKYDDRQPKKEFWVPQPDCPQIEVKSFFGKKYMVSLRDQHYGGKYLVMVGAHINVDYLLSFFDSRIFSDEEIKKLYMPKDFIISDELGLIEQTKPVVFNEESLGEIEILCVTTASEFMKNSIKLQQGDIPKYFVDVTKRKVLIKPEKYKHNLPISEYCVKSDNDICRFNEKWDKIFNIPKEKTLDIVIDKPESLLVIGNSKQSVCVLAMDTVVVNDHILKKGEQYNINFSTFGEIAGEEYFINKGLVKYLPNKKSEMIEALAKKIKDN